MQREELEAQLDTDPDPDDLEADPDALHVDDKEGGADAPGPTTMGGPAGEPLEASQRRELGPAGSREVSGTINRDGSPRGTELSGSEDDDEGEELDEAGEPILRGEALEAKGKELGISGWGSMSADEKRAAVTEAEA